MKRTNSSMTFKWLVLHIQQNRELENKHICGKWSFRNNCKQYWHEKRKKKEKPYNRGEVNRKKKIAQQRNPSNVHNVQWMYGDIKEGPGNGVVPGLNQTLSTTASSSINKGSLNISLNVRSFKKTTMYYMEKPCNFSIWIDFCKLCYIIDRNWKPKMTSM